LYRIKITPNRHVNRYDIFVKNDTQLHNLKANGAHAVDLKTNIINLKSNKLLSYYVVDNLPLELEFSINTKDKLELELLESSFDLMTNPQFSVAKRKAWMIPTPFVLNDAVVIKEKIKASPKVIEEKPLFRRVSNSRDSITATVDTIHR